MTDMVVCGDDKSGVHQGVDQVEVAAVVLPESVDDLDDTPVFTGGDIQGALDHVTAVAGRKADFLIHERFLLGGGKRGFPGR